MPTYGCVGVFMGAALDSDARYPFPYPSHLNSHGSSIGGFGHCRSSRLWHGNDMDTYADDLNELFTALEVKGVTMIGHSTGGGNSTAWPEMRPLRISLGGSNSLIVSGSSYSVCPSFELAAQADRRIRCCCRRVPRGDGFDLAQAPRAMPGAQ